MAKRKTHQVIQTGYSLLIACNYEVHASTVIVGSNPTCKRCRRALRRRR